MLLIAHVNNSAFTLHWIVSHESHSKVIQRWSDLFFSPQSGTALCLKISNTPCIKHTIFTFQFMDFNKILYTALF